MNSSLIPLLSFSAALGFMAASTSAQIIDTESGSVAGIPVNYTEAKTGQYTLPDPLILANGERVADAKTWIEQRRPELFKLIE